MLKIAIIDLLFHKKTKSFDFLKNIIQKDNNIDYFYDNSLDSGKVDKSYILKEYDLYIFFQISPDFSDLLKLKNKNIVFVPMYDSSILNKYAWEYFKGFNIKILCFSKILNDFLIKEGFDCLYIKYFLPPLKYNINYSKKNIYFWYRGGISWNDVKKVIGKQKINGITIKNVPDPGFDKLEISRKDISNYNINFVNTFFNTHEEHYKHLANHNIFIAPRKKEGIGMSFLDSMSIGQCIIGYNEATMNEYIVNGKNGLLTNFNNEVKLDNYKKIGIQCKEKYLKDYKYWKKKNCDIINFINGDYKSVSKINIIHYILYIIIKIRRFILKFKKPGNFQ